MRRYFVYILPLLLVICGAPFYASYARVQQSRTDVAPPSGAAPATGTDSVNVRFPVARTQPKAVEEIGVERPFDLKSPENVKTEIEYDITTGRYLLKTKLGDDELGTSFYLSQDEYMERDLQRSMQSYFRRRNVEEFEGSDQKKFDLTDINFDIGAADRIFGPGGVRLTTQGFAEITMGLKNQKKEAPTASQRERNKTTFKFDENVQMNVTAKVGEKVSFGMNYNTKTTFDFDTKKIKLAYEGNEDEIIKNLEAGNVSMTTTNSLIRGGTALFGIKGDFQFGKLKVGLLASQQESESKTVSAKGGVQTTPFEIKVDQYEENQNFFLSYYFRNNYDKAMSSLPSVRSSVTINKIEVWVTNKKATFEQARNIVAFSDLAERDSIYNDKWQGTGALTISYNGANTLYNELITKYGGARDINKTTQILQADGFEVGMDYEKIESARLLTQNTDYTLNAQLGYINLKMALQPDEVLGVAYEYIYEGQTYKVGEFSSDNRGSVSAENSNLGALYVKLIKGTSMTPSVPYWGLMMRNIYRLGTAAYSIEKDKFRLNVQYQSDTTGLYLNYIPGVEMKGMKNPGETTTLLRVMNLDNLDFNNNYKKGGDGFFDFVEGLTAISSNGKIIFPVVEPFGRHLEKMIDDPAVAEKYVYKELYDSTKIIAQQVAEKNKFLLKGEYKSSRSGEISLGATNVAKGSVRVTAGGVELIEGTQYQVNYMMGTVTITDPSIIDAGTPISVSLENQSMFSMQRKTMLGMNLAYEINPNFMIGGTIMHLYEVPLTMNIDAGSESLKNTLWGFNTSYSTASQFLTNTFDKLPFLQLSKPSQISFNAEFAHLIPGHYENKYGGNYSYMDDFESAQVESPMDEVTSWSICSVPYNADNDANPLFPEANRANDISYGYKRAMFAWYNISDDLTRKGSSVAPSYLRNDLDQLSNHYVREVYQRELYPNREETFGESSRLRIFNLAYYPRERGPFNLDVGGMNTDGTLKEPEKRFGGIMRKMESTNFETANYEYIEFWMLDPFIYGTENAAGVPIKGSIYFNLGEVSEDILKDEMKFFESGLPASGDTTLTVNTVWGKVPRFQATTYNFDKTNIAMQDVGLDGLRNEEEFTFPAYKTYLDSLEGHLSDSAKQLMKEDQFSPFRDPSGDNYHHFRGEDYDYQRFGILERYKRYNGTEGNSQAAEEKLSAPKVGPDVEDINQDYTLNENESYFEYKIDISPNEMEVGRNYITEVRNAVVKLRNGTTDENVKWYHFKIPIRTGDRRTVGKIQDFSSIRFMRMFMTGFADTAVFRLADFQLRRGEWRVYERSLTTSPSTTGTLDISAVNIEENGDREPVNYVLPPGVTRILDPSQPQIRQQNEQALLLNVLGLGAGDARAAYKNTWFDIRQYRRLQMFVHAERLILDDTDLKDGDLSVFLRFGTDYKDNYYEYEVPLSLTPAGSYNTYSASDREIVWPSDNMLDFSLSLFTNLKLERNRMRTEGAAAFTTPYSIYDPSKPRNKVTVIGNPSLSDIKTIMIGVRNNTNNVKSGVVWVNDLRLTEFNEDGGWAANANLNVALSDLGTVNLSGRIETAGFGGLDQSLTERRLDDLYQYNVVTNIQFGKFFPEKAKVSIPFYYGYSKERLSPKYNPLDQDVLLKDVLGDLSTQRERDSLSNMSIDQVVKKGFSISNMKVDIKSKNPMPYDPANFGLGFGYSLEDRFDPSTEYERFRDIKANLSYGYTPFVKPLQPFSSMKSKSKNLKFLKEIGINYLPSNISFQTLMSQSYYELQLRDLAGASMGDNAIIPPSFRNEFLWNRNFSLRWDIFKNLQLSFASGTNARIEDGGYQANRGINPDEYELFRDTVWKSIRSFGTPLKYDQTFNATFNLPTKSIAVLDWTNFSATYNAVYNWDKGAVFPVEEYGDTIVVGNTITNRRDINFTGKFNMEGLYNKSKYLKEVNQRFSRRSNANRNAPQKPEKPKKFETEILLRMDTTINVQHNLDTRKPRVSARKVEDSLAYGIKFKPLSKKEIRVLNKDSILIAVTVLPPPKKDNNFWFEFGQYSTRFLMMVRSVDFSYRKGAGLSLPGFKPNVGDMLGQRSTAAYGFAPGVDFAFGFTGEDYWRRANDKGWLVKDSEGNLNPAVYMTSDDLNFKGLLEPFKGLKIDLAANRKNVENEDIYFMYENPLTRMGGSFSMTTIAISTVFERSKASDNYYSKTFARFQENREIVAGRLDAQYKKIKPGNPESISPSSPDVLIPAFIAAYSGKDPGKVQLTAFPSLKALLPNWKLTFDGLNSLAFFQKHLKEIRLTHAYECRYMVGSYSSFSNWKPEDGDFGFIEEVIPSFPYDISAVSIVEQFKPLLGAGVTLKNDLKLKVELNKGRNLNLNIASLQIVEALTKDWIFGIDYTIKNFNEVLKMKPSTNVSNDLKIKADFTFRHTETIIRKIKEDFSQATAARRTVDMKLSAEYALSKMLTARAFYDLRIEKPLISSSSYPSSSSNYGIALRFQLQR